MEPVCDLKIEHGEPAFGTEGEPLLLHDEAAVAQDLQHTLLDRGLVMRLVGARAPERQAIRQRMKLAVREDERLQPDSIEIVPESNERTLVTAASTSDNPIETHV